MALDSSQIEMSIVVPVFNEEEILGELLSRIQAAVAFLTLGVEIIFVNDGSTDKSLSIIQEFAKQNKEVKFLSFSRNFGHQVAIMAGIDYAKGNTVITIDGDLQDPPELISQLYDKYTEGYKVVYAKRTSRKGEGYLKKLTARFFYRILKKITAIDIPLDTGDFRLIARPVVESLKSMRETNKFLRGQIAWVGYKQTFVTYDRDERKSGVTKYTYRKMARLAADGITSFSNLPLQLAIMLGFIFSIVAFLIILYALYAKFVLHQAVTGWTSLIISTMFIGSVQLLCLGIIGEYISRIASDARKRPLYIIEESEMD